jgi:hypothetical protein
LEKATSIKRNKVQESLRALEQAGAIVRVHVLDGLRDERRIYLGEAVTKAAAYPPRREVEVHPTAGGSTTPHGGVTEKNTPKDQIPKTKRSPRRPSDLSLAQVSAASRDNWTVGQVPEWLASQEDA